MIQELVIAFLLGLIGGVIPGPVITAIFTEILQSGLPRSMRIILIALVTETSVAIVSLLLLESLRLHEGFFRILSLAGAALLLWIAGSIFRIRKLETGQKVHFSTPKIIGMILTNGVLWTYWLTVCIPKALLLGERMDLGAYLFMGLVQLGWLISTLLLALLFARFRRILSGPRVFPVLFKIFAGAFVYFAADMVYQSIRYFTQGA
jgi:threonine/homoserine/homoserine lactone efflux protein